MPYGQGQALGATIDPRMFVQDYSGFANAAAIQAAGMMNFGNQIGGAISDYAKESKALKGEIAKGKSALAFAKAYHPELADKIDQLGQIFQDPTKSVVEQAAAGSQMGDFVAAILGGERFNKEMALKEREAAQTSRINDVRLTEAEMGLAERTAKNEADATVAPIKLAAAIEALKATPQVSGMFSQDYLDKAKNMRPEAQSALADTIVGLLPKPVQRKLANIPATIGGQPGELPVLVDDYGNVDPVQMDGMVLPPEQGGELDPPPADIFTNEGPALPANESRLVGEGKATDGTPIEIWQYQGRNYTAPKQTGPAPQGVTFGKVTPPAGALTEKNKFDIAKEQKADAAAQAAAVAKSNDFLLTLDKLEKHPGFDGLFGFGVGATKIPGTDAASAKVVFEQLMGKGFLESIQDMRGMGALSNAEGEKLSSAFLGLSPDMSEKDAKARIKEIKELVGKGLQRAATIQAQQAPVDPLQSAASRLGGMIRPRLD